MPKGDFSRLTFRPKKRFSGVMLQQGRVLLDADFNEQQDILTYLERRTRRDVIGRSGVPRDPGGFEIIPVGFGDAIITPGRMYVRGLLCECPAGDWLNTAPALSGGALVLANWPADSHNLRAEQWLEVVHYLGGGNETREYLRIQSVDPAQRKIFLSNPPQTLTTFTRLRWVVSYLMQPDVPRPAGSLPIPLILDFGTLVYIDVWTRHLTVLEDPSIREVALGGPDTSTRTKTVWQVRNDASVKICDDPNVLATTGRLAAFTDPAAVVQNVCDIPPSAGYRGIQNQLYRVEIHDGGDVPAGTQPTWVWSRDNGSIAFAIVGPPPLHPKELRLASLGRDERTSIKADDWVELIDDVSELAGDPGQLVQVDLPPQDPNRVVTLKDNVVPLDYAAHPRLRLWSGKADLIAGTDVALENGVSVRFDAGRYNTGDYWTIPARSAFGRDTGEVEWPNDGGTPPRAFPLPPEGIRHRYAPLAVISNFSDQGLQIRDCRQLFAPLTELISLVYVSGDAQVLAAPQLDLTASPRLPVRLPLSLKAGVFNGRIPVDAYVRFSISSGQGRLIDPATGASGANIRVRTDNLGIAACWWNVDTLGSGSQVTHPVQTVVARLLDSNDNPYEMLIYHATLNTAARVAFHPPENCRDLADARDVQRAIEILCERDCCVCTISVRPAMRWEELQFEVDRYRRVELCFAEGDYTAEPTALLFKNHDYVKITGAGDGTRITSSTPDGIFTFSGVKSVIVRDLSLTKTMADTLTACLHANSCARVVVEHVNAQNADDSENKLGRSQCVLIESESGVDSRAEVRFCRFDVGERQSGLILHDIKHAFVEDNVIVPVPRNWNWVYDDNLPTPFLIEAMPSKAAKAAPNAAPDVLLRSPIAITKESWTKAISLMPPDEVNNVGEADRLRRVTRRLLEDQAFRANPDLHEFIWWINGVTDIFFGIGATGSVTQELQILGNRIENAMQAIMCDSDDWDRIVIARNFIVMLEGTDNQNYHAIVTSKVRSQIIERNRIRGTKMQGVATGIEAIPESEFIMIRENHIEALTWGIKFDVPTDAAGASSVPPGVQWMIVDNLTRGGSNDLPSSSPGLRVTNNIQS